MRINGYDYRFAAVGKPPLSYGVGMDDPENEYWVVPSFNGHPDKVFVRPILAVEEDGARENWKEIEDEGLLTLAKILGCLSIRTGDEVYLRDSGFLVD